ncbi:unnamed protein product [Alopecurus aequalis]
MAASTRSSNGDGNQAAWPPYMARFERLEKLGEGINGEVFKAWDTHVGRIVAVKRLSAAGGDGFIASGLPEVLRECRSLKTCEGIPSIVKLREKVVPAVQSAGDPFIVMEYAGRINLRSYMQLRARRHRRFSEAEVRRIMKRLLDGVKSVHGKGIMHLDIKPENVILDDDTEDMTERPKEGAIQDRELKKDSIVYKIGGFGMSRKKERGPTQAEVVILTPYSAPELLLRSREYDEGVDMWGLGCIMTELLSGTGKPTFSGESDKEIMAKVSGLVGVQGIKDWPGIAEEWKSKLTGHGNISRLRRRFPWRKLSSAGFEVLSGLLESNPAKRLSAEEALQKPWFQERPRRGFGGCFR